MRQPKYRRGRVDSEESGTAVEKPRSAGERVVSENRVTRENPTRKERIDRNQGGLKVMRSTLRTTRLCTRRRSR